MINVEEAKRIMMGHVPMLPFAPTLIEETNGCVLAQDVFAPHPHPLFDMSAVDGYAVRGEGPQWRVVASIAAGQVLERGLSDGESARILTGASIPPGTRCVVMQEQCERIDDRVRVTAPLPREGANVRRKGEQFQAGELLLARGQGLEPAGIGLLASAGVTEVDVAFKPYVAIVRTGNEFLDQGTGTEGHIFSSNDRMLHAALHGEECEVDEQVAFVAGDDDASLTAAVRDALAADVIITTGGVSVGDHDRVETVLRRMGAVIHFHGVAQKPGKPMLFATLDGKPVFGLPGNPRAVMVLYWEYVLPFLRAMQGAAEPWPRTDRMTLVHSFDVKGERAEFRPARLDGGMVRPLADEGSHMLRSLIDADVLVYLPVEKRRWQEGEAVEVHFLRR